MPSGFPPSVSTIGTVTLDARPEVPRKMSCVDPPFWDSILNSGAASSCHVSNTLNTHEVSRRQALQTLLPLFITLAYKHACNSVARQRSQNNHKKPSAGKAALVEAGSTIGRSSHGRLSAVVCVELGVYMDAAVAGKLPFSAAPPDDRNLADMHLALYNNVLVFDHATKLAYVIAWVHMDDYADVDAAFQVNVSSPSLAALLREGAAQLLNRLAVELHRGSCLHCLSADVTQCWPVGVDSARFVCSRVIYFMSVCCYQLVLIACFEVSAKYCWSSQPWISRIGSFTIFT